MRLSGGRAASMAVQMSVGLWKPRYSGRNRAAVTELPGGLAASGEDAAPSPGALGASAAGLSGEAVGIRVAATGAAESAVPRVEPRLVPPAMGGGLDVGRLRRLGRAAGPGRLESIRRRRVVPGPACRRRGAGHRQEEVRLWRTAVGSAGWPSPAGTSARRGLVRGGASVSSGGRRLAADRPWLWLSAFGVAAGRLAGAWVVRRGRVLRGGEDPEGLRGRLLPMAGPRLSVAPSRGRAPVLLPPVAGGLGGGCCGPGAVRVSGAGGPWFAKAGGL